MFDNAFSDFLDPFYRPVHLAMIFMLGACFGSFFNVCIYRIPLGISLSYPGSHCYRCGRPVAWYDNIPMISYWVLGGHCRQCGAHFSMRYFLIELMTAIMFTITFLRIGTSLALLPALVFLSLLIIGSFTDIDHWIIPDRISLGGLAVGLVLAAVWPLGLAPGNPLAEPLFPVAMKLSPLASAAAGALIGFAALWLVGFIGTLIFRKDAMGMGDMKLFAMFGAFTGPFYLPHILILACLIGIIVWIVGWLRGQLAGSAAIASALAPLKIDAEASMALMAGHPLAGEERAAVEQALLHPGPVGVFRHHLPFGPSLAIAAWIVYLFGSQLSQWFVQHWLEDPPPTFTIFN